MHIMILPQASAERQIAVRTLLHPPYPQHYWRSGQGFELVSKRRGSVEPIPRDFSLVCETQRMFQIVRMIDLSDCNADILPLFCLL